MSSRRPGEPAHPHDRRRAAPIGTFTKRIQRQLVLSSDEAAERRPEDRREHRRDRHHAHHAAHRAARRPGDHELADRQRHAAAEPWITRNTISSVGDDAIPHSTEPTVKSTSEGGRPASGRSGGSPSPRSGSPRRATACTRSRPVGSGRSWCGSPPERVQRDVDDRRVEDRHHRSHDHDPLTRQTCASMRFESAVMRSGAGGAVPGPNTKVPKGQVPKQLRSLPQRHRRARATCSGRRPALSGVQHATAPVQDIRRPLARGQLGRIDLARPPPRIPGAHSPPAGPSASPPRPVLVMTSGGAAGRGRAAPASPSERRLLDAGLRRLDPARPGHARPPHPPLLRRARLALVDTHGAGRPR